MDTVLLFMSASVVVGLIYFVFFRETRYVPSHNAAVKSVDLEPLVIRDFTKNELSAYNGRDGRLVYLAADGIVFNMSSNPSGPSFYGPGGPYELFAGCDATIGLSTMQTDPSKCTKQVVAELSASERDVLSNWVERFSMKYELAGYLTEGANPKSLATMRGGAVDKSS